jgi:hypothetical protein
VECNSGDIIHCIHKICEEKELNLKIKHVFNHLANKKPKMSPQLLKAHKKAMEKEYKTFAMITIHGNQAADRKPTQKVYR